MKATYLWQARMLPAPTSKKLLHKLIKRAAELAGLPVAQDWQANVIFVGDRAMARANHDYVGHEGTTDVITFSYFDEPESMFPGDLGVELLISAQVAAKEGDQREDSSYGYELALYISHGFLHSAGEDDLDDISRPKMRQREAEVMAVLTREFALDELFVR